MILGLCLGQNFVEHPLKQMTSIPICCVLSVSRITGCEVPYRRLHALSFKVRGLGLA